MITSLVFRARAYIILSKDSMEPVNSSLARVSTMHNRESAEDLYGHFSLNPLGKETGKWSIHTGIARKLYRLLFLRIFPHEPSLYSVK